MTVYLLVLAAAALLLARSSVFLIDKLIAVAIKLRISEYLIGFAIMAIATAIPELVVGIISAIKGDPNLSLGNVIGSNIVNMSFILGIATLISGGLRIQTQVRNREVFFTDLIGIIPLAMLIDGRLTRWDGLILVFFFLFYLYNLVFKSREYHRVVVPEHRRTGRSLEGELLLFGIGLVIVAGSAWLMVVASEKLAILLGIPMILFGLFAVALSTSLPELSTSISAAIHRQSGFVMGNILGSTVANSALILGITAVIKPFTIENPLIFGVSAGMLVITLLVLTIFIRTGWRITWVESLILIMGYVAYVAVTELLLR